MGYSVVDIAGIEAAGPGGAVRFVRRELGVFTAPVAFRFDPETVRQVTAGPDGLTMIAVGARRGSYEPRGPF